MVADAGASFHPNKKQKPRQVTRLYRKLDSRNDELFFDRLILQLTPRQQRRQTSTQQQ